MSLRDYEQFVRTAGFMEGDDPVEHWQRLDKKQRRLAAALKTATLSGAKRAISASSGSVSLAAAICTIIVADMYVP